MIKVSISNGNIKLGKIANVSLPPVITCNPQAPCHADCYANKAWRLYPTTRKAWNDNLIIFKKFRHFFFDDINEFLRKYKQRYFRWHVAGDIPNRTYFRGMVRLAKTNPNIRFLALTKRYNIINNYNHKIPDNLRIVFSSWPKLRFSNPNKFPVAWLQDGTEDRIPNNALECPGNCETCGMCWSLKDLKRDMVFNKH